MGLINNKFFIGSLVILLSFVFLLQGVSAVTNVSECMVLDTPNEIYQLNRSIESSGTCINITSSNITLDCQGFSIENASIGIYLDSADNVTILNCEILNLTNTGILVNNSNECSITNTNISNVLSTEQYKGYGIHFSNSTLCNVSDLNIYNVTTSSSDSWKSGFGIIFENSSRNTIDKTNISFGNGGIFLDYSNNTNISSSMFISNTDFVFEISPGSDNTLIDNCQIINNSDWSILVYSNNNTIQNNVFSEVAEGIGFFDGSSNNVVSGNIINKDSEVGDDKGCTGVRLADSSYNKIYNNTINNYRGHITLLSANNNIIANNTITKSWEIHRPKDYLMYYGIMLYLSSNNSVLNNNIQDINGTGIKLFGNSENNVLQANNITNSYIKAIGIYYESNNNNLTFNEISKSGYGVVIDKSYNNIVYNNSFLENSIGGFDNANNFWNYSETGNYWSDYEGGGSEPYLISLIIMDRRPLLESPQTIYGVVEEVSGPSVSLSEGDFHVYSEDLEWNNTEMSNFTVRVSGGYTLNLTEGAIINQNIIVSNGTLNIIGVNVTLENRAFIKIEKDGKLVINNSVIIGRGHYISLEEGSELNIQNSQIKYLGSWESAGGFQISTNNTIIQKNEFYLSYSAINIDSGTSGHNITGNNFTKTNYAIYTTGFEKGNDFNIQDNNFWDSLISGILAKGLINSTLLENNFQNIWGYGIFLDSNWDQIGNENNIIYNNSFINCDLDERFDFAYDGQVNNSWNYSETGNYWSDYEGEGTYILKNQNGEETLIDYHPLIESRIFYYKGINVLEDNKTVEILFSKNLSLDLNETEIKTNITFSSNVSSLNSLGENDNVTIEGNKITITFESELGEKMNRFVIINNTLKDVDDNYLNYDVVIGFFGLIVAEEDGNGDTNGNGNGGNGGGGNGAISPQATDDDDEIYEPVDWEQNYSYTSDELSGIKSVNEKLKEKERIIILIEGNEHHVGVIEIDENIALIGVASTPVRFRLSVGESEKVDVTGDDYYDLEVILNAIEDDKADLTINSIREAVLIVETTEDIEDEEEKARRLWVWLLILIVVVLIMIIIIVVFLLLKYLKKENYS